MPLYNPFEDIKTADARAEAEEVVKDEETALAEEAVDEGVEEALEIEEPVVEDPENDDDEDEDIDYN